MPAQTNLVPEAAQRAYAQWLDAHPEPGSVGTHGWRRSCVWSAADILSLSSTRITVDMVVTLVGFGSRTDITRDLDEWRNEDLRRRNWFVKVEPLLAHPEVMPVVARAIEALAASISEKATAAARADLAAERDAFGDERAVLRSQHESNLAELARMSALAEESRTMARALEDEVLTLKDRLQITSEQLAASSNALIAERAASRERERALQQQVTAASDELTKAAQRLAGLEARTLLDVEHERQRSAALDSRLKEALAGLQAAQQQAESGQARADQAERGRRAAEVELAAQREKLDGQVARIHGWFKELAGMALGQETMQTLSQLARIEPAADLASLSVTAKGSGATAVLNSPREALAWLASLVAPAQPKRPAAKRPRVAKGRVTK